MLSGSEIEYRNRSRRSKYASRGRQPILQAGILGVVLLLVFGCGQSDSHKDINRPISGISAAITGTGGLSITAAATPLAPPKEDPAILVCHAFDDKGGNTSLRFVEDRKIDENKYPLEGVSVFSKADRHQPQRDRDLGQTFLAGDKPVKLDALYLRIGHADLAALDNAPGARVAVQWFQVSGRPALNDHGTPGFAGLFNRSTSPELDDYLEGETYTPLRTVEGRFPESLSKGDYIKIDFVGDDEFVFEPRREYAFLLMFLDRKAHRGMTLANEYYGTYRPDPENRYRGHAIRREGLPAFPDDWKSRLTQPPGTIGFPDVCTFRDLHFAVTVKPAGQATRSFAPPAPIDFRHPQREYISRSAGGWTFHLERDLVERHPERADRVIHRLEMKLAQTLQLLPAHARPRLQKLSLFVLMGPDAIGGGRNNGAEYFRKIDPDYHSRLDLRWRSAIVIYSAENYLFQDEHWAVQMLLHEFAHAWQLEQWPEKQPEIFDAWRQAQSAGLYRKVKDVNGTVVESAYAIHNQLEYFSELSCVYFWRGEYEPFDRRSLQEYDPAGCAMIETMWGVHGSPPPPSPKAGMVE